MATITANSSFTMSWVIPKGHDAVTESNLRLIITSTTGLVNTYYSSTDGTTVGLFTVVQATLFANGSITALPLTIPTVGKQIVSLESLSTTDANKNVYSVLSKTSITVLASDTEISAGNIA
jgi:hypothetical protein